MAKLKKTENMSALDYLCKKLNWLVKKIEASSRGKISKRDLLIYGLIIIFVLSVGLGGVIGAFTFVLAVATIWNVKITKKLLKQSEAASKQSRAAFLGDMIVKTLSLEERVSEQWSSGKSLVEGRSFIEPGSLSKDIAEMLGSIDEGLKRDFVRAVAGEDLKDKSKDGKKEE